MKKIPLVLDFQKIFTIQQACKLAQSRRFVSLELDNVKNSVVESPEFMALMGTLSKSVTILAISYCKCKESRFRSIIQIYLVAKLVACELHTVSVAFKSGTTNNVEAVSGSNLSHPLKDLFVSYTDGDVARVFTNCTYLKST